MTVVGIDFETVCYDPTSVVSVGIAFRKDGEIFSREWYVKPPEGTEFRGRYFVDLPGITEDKVKDAPVFPEVWSEICALIGDDVLYVAHNAKRMELRCLQALFEKYDMPECEINYLCTYQIARELLPFLPRHKLPDVARFFGISLECHHNAEDDARACFEIYEAFASEERVSQALEADLVQGPDGCTSRARQRMMIDYDHLAPYDGRFSGLSIVLSGDFGFPREELQSVIEAFGGTVKSSVSRHTDILVLGPDFYEAHISGAEYVSGKREQARKHGTRIISWPEFFEMMKNE